MKKRAALMVMTLALMCAPAFGQGCAMCYESAKGASTKGQKALSNAVTILLIPPVGMMVAIVGFAFRYSRRQQME